MTDDVYIDSLPGVLAEIARLTNIGVAVILAHEFGGTRIYIPKRPTPDSPITHALGLDAATVIGHQFGGDNVLIPLGPAATHARKHKLIQDLLKRGDISKQEIARRAECHVRTVYRHVPEDKYQMSLFESPEREVA